MKSRLLCIALSCTLISCGESDDKPAPLKPPIQSPDETPKPTNEQLTVRANEATAPPPTPTNGRPGTPGSEKQDPSNRSKAEDQMQLIITGLMRYEKEYGELPKPVDNSGEGTNGAKALYQALSGDGDTQLVVGGGAGGTPSTGIVGSTAEALVEGIDPKANKHGLVSADYALVDPLGQFWRYRVYDADVDDQTNNKTFDLWSIGEDGKEDDEAKWIKNW